MTRRLRFLLLLATLLLSAGALRADMPSPFPRPRPPRPPFPSPESVSETTARDLTASLTIEVDENAREPRLVIPRKLIAAWSAGDKKEGTHEHGSLRTTPWHTIIAGVA